MCIRDRAIRWRAILRIHLPAVFWGAFVEFSGWICPLTPLENWLREQGGEASYQSDFVMHYVLLLLYPAGLTQEIQLVLGTVVLIVNASIYGWLWRTNRL